MSETVHHIFPAMAAVTLGAVVHSILGFGCSLVWMSFFPLFTSVAEAVGVLQPLAIGLNFLLITQLWKHACLEDLRPLTVVVPIGILAGLWVIATWPPHVINGLLGVFLLLYAASAVIEQNSSNQKNKQYVEETYDLELLLVQKDDDDEDKNDDRGRAAPVRNYIAFPAAFVGGCLTSALGTGGPAILVFAREAGWQHDPQKFRANLQVVLFSMNVLAISSQMYSGIINLRTLGASIQLVPAMIVGGWLGIAIAPKVRKDIFQNLTLYGVAIMGILFVYKAFKERWQWL
jgi:uncharacterized membrane protein YfcA